MNHLRFIITLFLWWPSLTLSAQLILEKDFTIDKPPRIASKNWFMLNRGSAHYFKTNMVNGELLITRTDFVDSVEFNISGGRLLGIDHGEWGGTLTFIPHDTGLPKKLIANGNIRFIFSFGCRIYFIDGLAHLSMSEGALFAVDTAGQQFTVSKVVDFDDAPEAMTVFNNKILIVAHGSFFLVDEQLNKTKLFSNTFWQSLYPSSIAVRDMKHVYVGMRGGLIELNLINRSFIFYRYNEIRFGNRAIDYDTPMYELDNE